MINLNISNKTHILKVLEYQINQNVLFFISLQGSLSYLSSQWKKVLPTDEIMKL